jgi:DNA-binding HxlR family transcriptional regulator
MKMKEHNQGRYSYNGISRLIHEKARLSILTSLFTHREGLTFQELKELCDLSDGNLSRHARILEEAGLIKVHKGFEGRRPRTDYIITEKGTGEFLSYLGELENVIRDAHAENKKKAVKENPDIRYT